MLVEKSDIEKAKEKLGDKNATLIFDILGIGDYDKKNLKSCCPYHDEKTPSFIYDRKAHRFHCFGCGVTVDVIDVLMEKKNYTFLDAVKFLFDNAGMEYSFGEQSVKTRQKYNYPQEESLDNDRTQVFDYLKKRGISKNVIDYLDIRADGKDNMVFNYFDTNDVLTMVKYRPARTVNKGEGCKTWCQKGADTTPLLFNMNRVNITKPLLICEGEVDCASAIQSGFLNSVSVPLGAGNLHWIEENWDWLDQIPEIIIWSDNDEPGEKMRKDCIYRLGTWRTKYVVTPAFFKKDDGSEIPLNDINDCLQIGGEKYVLDLINNAKDVPVTSVVDYSEIEQLDISDMEGIKSGIKPLDDILIKTFYGTLTILSGRPGSGKTSLIDQMAAKCMDDGNPVFLFSKELPERMSSNWFNTIIAGRRNMKEMQKDGDTFWVVPYNIQNVMQQYYKGKLLIYKDDEPNDVESVLKSAEECVRKYGVKFIILDNLMMLDLQCSESDRNLAQTNLINDLIRFASKFNVAVTIVCHPRKTQDSNTDIEMYDISGSSNIINLAMRSIGLRRVSRKEKEDPRCKWSKYDVVLTIIKDRLLGKADVQIGLWYDNVSRRFYTDYDEYDMQYAWDKKHYLDRLPYEDRLHSSPEDIFPDK